MKNSTLFVIIILAMLLTVSLVYNIMLSHKNGEMETRINQFIPAARQIEAENIRLQEQAKSLQDKVFSLEHPRETKAPAATPQLQPVNPEMSGEMQPTQAPADFRDLNKKEGL